MLTALKQYPQFVDSVQANQAINTLLVKLLNNKKFSTAKNYKNHYNHFLKYACNQSIDTVSWIDILAIDFQTALNYQIYLYNTQHNSPSSINAKFASFRTLYDHLKKYNKSIDNSVITNVDKLIDTTDEDEKSYGSLTYEEVLNLYDYCLTLKEKAVIKMLFFKTCIITGNRKQSLLNLTWGNITKKQSPKSKEKIWTIYVYDKNKKVVKPITNQFYQELLQLRESNLPEEKVFKISDQTLRLTLHNYCETHNIAHDRNIVIHSLKKSSMDFVWNATNDIVATASQGSHTNIQTPYKYYLNKHKDFENSPSFYLFGNTADTEILQSASQQELLETIGKLDYCTKLQIVTVYKKLFPKK